MLSLSHSSSYLLSSASATEASTRAPNNLLKWISFCSSSARAGGDQKRPKQFERCITREGHCDSTNHRQCTIVQSAKGLRIDSGWLEDAVKLDSNIINPCLEHSTSFCCPLSPSASSRCDAEGPATAVEMGGSFNQMASQSRRRR